MHDFIGTDPAQTFHASPHLPAGFAGSVMQNAAALIVAVDREGRIALFNRACETLSGRSLGEVVGRRFWETLIPVEDQEAMKRVFSQLRACDFPCEIEAHWILKDGSRRKIAWTTSALSWGSDELAYVIGVGRDITEQAWIQDQVRSAITRVNEGRVVIEQQAVELQKANDALAHLNAKLENLASTDGLTGLGNYRAFQTRLREEMSRSDRHQLPLSLLMLDVDNFKAFNDAYGHPAGDAVLRQVACILNECSRKEDYVSRYGGEEFAMILPETNLDGAMQSAERVRSAVESWNWPHRQVTVTVGAAGYSPGIGDMGSLVDAADRALYSGKANGRNRVCAAPSLGSTDPWTADESGS